MRKVMCALALAAMTSQVAAPAFASNLLSSSGPGGWSRQGDGAVMAYFRMSFGGKPGTAHPRAGLKLVAPLRYGRDELAMHVNNPTLLDFSLTARNLRSSWTATANVGRTTAWASNPQALSPEARANLFGGNGWTWAAIGVATVGVGVGIFALTEGKK